MIHLLVRKLDELLQVSFSYQLHATEIMKSLTVVPLLASIVAGHGFLYNPKPRQPGPAFGKVCSQAALDISSADEFGLGAPIEGLELSSSNETDYDPAACQYYTCKGFKLEDNKENVQTFTPGQVVDMNVKFLAVHPGWANVSVIDLQTNTQIGEPLKVWDEYAPWLPDYPNVPEDNKNFSVEIPDLSGMCAEPGDCALQWFWFGNYSVQTYESCVDFIIE